MLPVIGTQQANLPFDSSPPFIRSRALVHFRAVDGVVGDNIIAPLTRQRMRFGIRTGTATVFASDGTSVALVRSAAAWSAQAWPAGSARNEMLLALDAEEYIRFQGVESAELVLPVRDLSGVHEWIHVADGPLFSLTNDAASGARIFGSVDAGAATISHHNGTSVVTSAVSGLTAGVCYSMRWQFDATTGAVRCWLKRGATESESIGALSDALAVETTWPNGVQYRVNEIGDSLRGAQRLRSSAVYVGHLNREQMEHML